VVLAAIIAVGCGDEGSGAYYGHVETLTESWSKYRVFNLEVETPRGDFDLNVGDVEDISATIYQSCISKNDTDAEAHVGDINITSKTTRPTLTLYVNAEMPESNSRLYEADFFMNTPVLDYIGLTTGEGDVKVRQQHGIIDVRVQDGHVSCDVAETNGGNWVRISVETGFIHLVLPANASAVFEIENEDGVVLINGIKSLKYDVAEEKRKSGIMGDGDASIIIDIGKGDVVIEGR
jgi:hypothetical protein